MRDDRLPIMDIFTALFFIEADYVTTLLNPYFLDFERGWILCIAALRTEVLTSFWRRIRTPTI